MPTADINGAEIYFETTGDGPPLLLIHGGFFDHHLWMFVVPALAEAFTVITFDQRGHGRSVGPMTDPQDLIEDAAGLIEHLGLGPVHVAGQSMGAVVALGLAARHPGLLRSVSVHEPGLFTLLPEPLRTQVFDGFRPVSALFNQGDVEGGLDAFITEVGGDWSIMPEPIKDIFRRSAANYPPDWLDRGFDIDPREELEVIETVARFGGPIQLTLGDGSPPMFTAMTRAIKDAIPQAELVIIEGAGHAAMLEKPTEYAAALRDGVRAGVS